MWQNVAVAMTLFVVTAGDVVPSGCQKQHDIETDTSKLKCLEPNIDDILNYLVNTTDDNFIAIDIFGCKSGETNKGSIKLNSTIFEGHPGLVNLSFELCEIKHINAGTFKSLKKLRNLDLSGNDLGWGELLQQAFSGLEQLETLNLDYNDLQTKELQENTFTGLLALRNLSLNGNHLHSFVPGLNQPRLGLVLSNNWLSTATLSGGSTTTVCLVDYTKSGITSLTNDNLKNIKCNDPDGVSLIFRWNAFTSFDANMFEGLGSFKELDFSGVTMQPALIKSLVTAIKGRKVATLRLARTLWTRENLDVLNASAIDYLDLSNNIITFSGAAETRSLSKLKSVRFLDLSYNGVVSSIVFEIPMPNLRYLDLSGTTIPLSPDSLSFEKNLALQNLETLKLFRSFIGECSVPKKDFSSLSWFHGLNNIRELSLDNNLRLFRCFNEQYFLGFFKGLTNLQNLSLSWTDFGEMDPSMPGFANIFADQANTIRHLNFLGGFITHRHISAGLIKNLRNLTHLNFQSNEIGYLFSAWFENLNNLKFLNLHDNKITTVVGTNGRFFPQSLSQLLIGQNAFACDCQLRLFAEWLHGLNDDSQMKVSDMDKAVCLTPIEYYGKNLRIEDFPSSGFVCSHGIELTSAAAALVLITVIVTLCCCFHDDLKYIMAIRRLHRAGGSDDRRPLLPRGSVKLIYDVRDDTDRQWINTNIGNIADCRDFNITVNHPDDIHVPGEERRNPLSQQIRDFRNQCYCTLLLVSNHFKQDLWHEVFANLTRQEIHNIRFILVLINDIRLRDLPRELKALAKQRPCFKWPTVTDGGCCGGSLRRRRQLFWRQLILALLPRR
ncbi:toll-like receptor 4 isoform X1 [Lineus longissimus]|uniref:toll-like receptor 4 isoform X1 n=1 Tax=Lineus longissimus TaxID=88925 RepID=UPI00315DBB29